MPSLRHAQMPLEVLGHYGLEIVQQARLDALVRVH
jgi:hypothetical protein